MLQKVSLADPRSERAEKALRKYDEYRNLTTDQRKARDKEAAEGFKTGRYSIAVTATVWTWITLAAVIPASRDGGSLFVMAVELALLVFGWWLFRVRGNAPRERYPYDKYVKRGRILQVPTVMRDEWERIIRACPGITRWSEYEQRRFDAFREMLLETGHLRQPFEAECRCGLPETCEFTTHLMPAVREQLQADALAVVRRLAEVIVGDFRQVRAAAAEQTEEYNLGLSGEKRPLPGRDDQKWQTLG